MRRAGGDTVNLQLTLRIDVAEDGLSSRMMNVFKFVPTCWSRHCPSEPVLPKAVLLRSFSLGEDDFLRTLLCVSLAGIAPDHSSTLSILLPELS